MRIEGSSIVITGGASGIGAACAQYLSNQGAKITIWDLNESGQALAQNLGGLFIKCDVTNKTDLDNALKQTLERFGEINVLVNSAGIVKTEMLVRKDKVHSVENFMNIMKVNVIGTFLPITTVVPQMAKQESRGIYGKERGVIINVSSIAAFEGGIGSLAYSASKGAVNGMALPLARDLAQFNIRIATLNPGFVDTPMKSVVGEAFMEYYKNSPIKRFGRPSEIALITKNLIENEYINGSTLRIDGGLRMPFL